ncbi:MAG TPA: NADP-dependent oxidoreductase [Polyangia bacterium]
MTEENLQVVLAARPEGPVDLTHFALVKSPVPTVGEGQVLVRNHYLSLDPYMRGRMNEGRSYAPPQKVGEVMVGGTVGEVVASRHPQFAVGQFVVAQFGWQLYGLSDGRGLRRVETDRHPLTTRLGVLGMTGVTAWYGINKICAPKAGETLVVSAASGAVGSVAGQLAKQAGCRVVGIAGGSEKCSYVREVLGFDAVVDHRASDAAGALAAATPQGIDCVFENVGGPLFDAALARMNAFGRIAICGLIAGYEGAPIPVNNVRSLLTNRLLVQGFVVSDHLGVWPAALADLERLLSEGALRYRETIAEGLASAPAAFLGLLSGKNFGKQLVKLI